MHLKPNFYKGYMRAAKAAHGKGMTTLALRRLNAGISQVTDHNGLRELNRLKTQYTAWMTLPSNADREIDFNIDRYHSSDDDYEPYSDEEDDLDEDDPESNPLLANASLTVKSKGAVSDQTTNAKKQCVTSNNQAGTTSNVNKKEKEVPESVKEESLVKEKTKVDVERKEKNGASVEATLSDVKPSFKDKNTKLETGNDKQNQPDSFLELAKELTKDPELSKHVEEFKQNLKSGREAFLSGNYRKAADCYKAAKERVGIKLSDYEIEDRQYQVILLAYSAALINLNSYDDIVKGIQTLTDMKVYSFSIPALYIQIANGYCKLNRFKCVRDTLDELADVLDNCPIFPTFTWPGSSDVIQETTPSGLQNAIKGLNQICKMPHKPAATCRFENCLKNSTHIVPSEFIYMSDPDFTGFVRMICEEKCHIDFHISCWKSYKESVFGIGKINDKDLLGRRCLTTDCVNCDGDPSVITVIEIIGLDGNVKSINKLEPKTAGEPNADSKKAKKKKSKVDEKEKSVKTKKVEVKSERKLRETKKTALPPEGDEESADTVQPSTDPVILLQNRKEAFKTLRDLNFGFSDPWEPDVPFYGQSEELKKWTECGGTPLTFSDPEKKESVEVKDAKDFLSSYVMQILKEEGPLKQSDVEDLWKQSAGDFCDITVVLPQLKSVCELLGESNCFCLMEDYICLASQLDEAHKTVETEVSETVMFLMTGRVDDSQLAPLPDLLQNPQTSTQFAPEVELSGSASDTDSEDEYNSADEVDSDLESEENDNSPSPVLVSDVPSSSADVLTEAVAAAPSDTAVDNTEEGAKEPMTLQTLMDKINELREAFKPKPDTFDYKTVLESVPPTTDESNKEKSLSDRIDSALANVVKVENENNKVDVENVEAKVEESLVPESVVTGTNEDSGTATNEDSGTATNEENVTVSTSCEQKDENLPMSTTASSKTECDKASQSGVATKDKLLQTAVLERKDKLTQTKESELFRELNKKVEESTKQSLSLSEQVVKLTEKVKTLECSKKELKKLHEENATNLKVIQRLCEEKKSLELANADLKSKLTKHTSELKQKDQESKQKEDLYIKEISRLKELLANVTAERDNSKKELGLSSKGVKDIEAKNKLLELRLTNAQREQKVKTLKSQKDHLQMIRALWEVQVCMLKQKGIEKIGEMHSWFSSVLPPEEVQNLPSMTAISQHIIQWGEINKKLDQSNAAFIEQYAKLEAIINQGEEVDLSSVHVPRLPEEPSPLSLAQVHKELMGKHGDKIKELTQLVANQQLEIAKSKQNNQQIQQLMDSFKLPAPAPPNIQTPMTTAFGGLALQYPYPQQPQPLHFYPPQIPTIPPNTDTSKVGNVAKPFQASDVHTLLQESSKLANKLSGVQEKPLKKDETSVIGSKTQSFTPNFLNMPPPSLTGTSYMPPPPTPLTLDVTDSTKLTFPPPPVGVAQNVFKSGTVSTDTKDKKPAERSSTPKPETAKAGTNSSRETTPIPVPPIPNATPEKSKKKKKNKTEVKDLLEVRTTTPPIETAAPENHEDWLSPDSSWSVVLPKSAMPRHTAPPIILTTDAKMQNKKKLLDKLQQKLPNTPVKELDEIVKIIRDQNNGSLSGLPFEEIIIRVERFIARRHFQKTSTMGLVKFSDAAWGPVKQQERVWSNLQLEECTICLEPMGNERTKVECNHEFHTKCLRKWLKEKSVCPLCNKFTTMPDEFPAL